ncbi:helix-turn-helix transcriptional regulator [uncultured Endozoicomonas sp.]|uniref:helix-turn-helix domain-containing protein n=1 Tax=uncultured Endozoicomonas sp. TaxID=432652 RepID=UPI0026144A6E|nr:helix-turn-helix transcriptional regulator [uncultured Endozoicomonas sp.]
MSKINKRIELIRKLEGLTRGELARKCNIPEQTLENIEYGKQRTPADLVEQMCELFPFASNYLITGKAEIKFTKKEKEKIKTLIHELETIDDLDTEINKRRRTYNKEPSKN